MKTGARVKGVEKVVKNLNKEIDKVQGRTLAGLYAAGLVIQATAQRRVPVEYGNLRASAYTRKKLQSNAAAGLVGEARGVEVGFAAAYAIYIHENMEQTLKGQARPSGLGVYWGPSGQPKFLESAMIDERDEVLRLVAAYAEVRGT